MLSYYCQASRIHKGVSVDMDSFDIVISQEQAKQIARAVIAEIEDYIEQHRSEYADFLKSAENEVNHDDLS